MEEIEKQLKEELANELLPYLDMASMPAMGAHFGAGNIRQEAVDVIGSWVLERIEQARKEVVSDIKAILLEIGGEDERKITNNELFKKMGDRYLTRV